MSNHGLTFLNGLYSVTVLTSLKEIGHWWRSDAVMRKQIYYVFLWNINTECCTNASDPFFRVPIFDFVASKPIATTGQGPISWSNKKNIHRLPFLGLTNMLVSWNDSLKFRKVFFFQDSPLSMCINLFCVLYRWNSSSIISIIIGQL